MKEIEEVNMFEENIGLENNVFNFLHAFLINPSKYTTAESRRFSNKKYKLEHSFTVKFTSLSKNSDETTNTWIKMAVIRL